VGTGQLGFTCVVAAETAEGLRKPEGGTGEEVVFLASHGRRELVVAERGTRNKNAVGTRNPRRGVVPEPSARAGGPQFGEEPFGRRTPAVL
jgi:hypothetical protein